MFSRLAPTRARAPVSPAHHALPVQLYDRIGTDYRRYRRPDPRIARLVHAALGHARSVVNVGAGAGAYEPADRAVVAVEPSAAMIAQRPAGAAPAARASAEGLPFPDAAFDAALATLAVHHWSDWRAGLREMTRVARVRVVLLTWDSTSDRFWLTRDYLPELLALDRPAFPSIAALLDALTGAYPVAEVIPVPVPSDCADGFLGAYWRRPAAYLDAGVRGAMSSFPKLAARGDGAVVDQAMERLAQDLAVGMWAARHGELLARDTLDLGYRLVVARR
jgi:SAM-dependent methyltransferase